MEARSRPDVRGYLLRPRPPGDDQLTAPPAAPAPTRRRRGSRWAEDRCPHCSADLKLPRGRTRRHALLSPAPGVFEWQCPDCRGRWNSRSGG